MPDAQGRYTLLALGDSVMWGQGLAAGHSFAQQVRDWLAHLKPHGATLASLARSGAILDATPRPFDGAARAPWLFGELPRSCPGIRTQAEIARGSAGYAGYLDADSWDPPAWATAKASVREQLAAYGSGGPNLILLDGGINDFNALQVVLPWKLGGPDRTCGGNSHSDAVERLLGAARAAGPGVAVTGRFDLPALEEMTDADFKQRIDRLVYGRMKPTLQRLQQIFPASQVIVTGYFPIFTPGSLEGLLTGSARGWPQGRWSRPAAPLRRSRRRCSGRCTLRWIAEPLPTASSSNRRCG